MTFGPIACSGSGFNRITTPYTESGFSLATPGPGGFVTWCSGNPSYAGNNLWISDGGTNALLTQNGGGPFSIQSIDLAHLESGTFGPQSFTFTGNLFGGGTVSQTFTIGAQSGSPTFSEFVFGPGWTNLSSVTFASQNSTYYQFSDVVLGAPIGAPEPATMTLLATGLVGLFGVARRRLI
jgi:hypothetical protein